MRFTLPKNRTTPLVLFAIISIITLLSLGLYHINKLATYSYKTKLENYDKLADQTAMLMKCEIEDINQNMQTYAGLIARAGALTRENALSLLTLITKDKSFEDAAIVGMNGKGYNLAGEEVDVSAKSYFTRAISGEMYYSDEITYSANQIPVLIYAVPISENGIPKGVFIAEIHARMTDPALIRDITEEGSVIYLINKSNQLVSYVQNTDPQSFEYASVIEEGITFEDAEKSVESMKLADFFSADRRDDIYIWIRKPIGINNWYLLIGRSNIDSPAARSILKLTNWMWVAIIFGTVIIFILMIYSQKKAHEKVRRTFYLDPVTGGENWYKFRNSVSKILNSKQFARGRYALVNFDINRFKLINDAYGYHKGDEILKDIYYVIKKWAEPGEPFTRYAADQFYILMSFQEEDEVVERLHELNDRIHELIYTSAIKIFFGVFYITERQYSIDRMAEFASIAMKNAKVNNKGIISFFDEVARGRLLEEEEIERSMNAALMNEEFRVFLQPKYSAREEIISGAEALVRWYNNKGKIVPPGYFIPVFEKNGFITELDLYMIRKVCEVIRGWLDKGYEPLPISVNISRLHFADPNLADVINHLVDRYGVPHHLIELELTESAFLQNKQMLISTVTKLRDYGFVVSMDDFGAGYSSLNSLKDLPLDVVKLDGELFRPTNEVERGQTVIRNTIAMAKDLHMKVVAECIETREQVEFLCTVGCDIIQGYYFAKPMTVEQFEERYFSISRID